MPPSLLSISPSHRFLHVATIACAAQPSLGVLSLLFKAQYAGNRGLKVSCTARRMFRSSLIVKAA